jgi:putative transcriptional regulator
MDSLKNQFLIAMPNLDDPYFKRSVIYLVKHDDEGAMGFIINQPISQLNVQQLLEKMEFPCVKASSHGLNQQVFNGGPVNQERGFVLHSPQSMWNTSESCSDDIMLTSSKDIMSSLGSSDAPEQFIIALGYASWTPGQLERELLDNSWLTSPSNPTHLFTTAIKDRWQCATAQLGFDVWQLTSQPGHS